MRIPASNRVLVLGIILLAACAKKDASTTDTAARAPDSAATAKTNTDSATHIATVSGFKTPESVKYDAEQDVYFVSNINGNPNQKDGNGFIAKVTGENPASMTMFIEGGKNGVTLNAPKGMAINGDTLWVADIDAVRGFDRKTGKPLANIELASLKATFLNDVTVGPDGIYVTDTGIHFDEKGAMTHPGTDMVIRISNGKSEAVLKGDALKAAGGPNGIYYDAKGGVILIGGFSGKDLVSFKPGSTTLTTVASGPGSYDGLEMLGDGRILVTSWADSSVSVVKNAQVHKLISAQNAPADIGVDGKRMRVAIPRFNENTVEIFAIR